MYFDDINLKLVVHRFFNLTEKDFIYLTENNSLELIRSGHLQLFRKRDGKMIDLTAPAFFWMKKGEEYQFVSNKQELPGKYIEHIYFDFDGERSERIISALDEMYPDGMLHPRDPAAVSDSFFRILQLYRIDPKGKLPEIGMLIEKLLFLACDSAQPRIAGQRDAYGLENIAEKLRGEPFLDYDFHKTAAELNLSMDHFRRLFRERHQLPPQEYLSHQRMIRSAELLEKTDMRIKEIVFTCHFKSLMDFSRSFRKYSGLSPRAYRRKKQQEK